MRKWITFNIFFNLVQGGKKEKKKRTLSDKQLPPFSIMIVIYIIFFTGFHAVLKLLWVLLHGLAAVKLIQHVLSTFPSCASIGMCLITFFGGDLFSSLIACNDFAYFKFGALRSVDQLPAF